MNQYEDFYNRAPTKLILLSFIVAMVVDFIPFSGSLYWLPELTALTLIYWLIHRPNNISIGTAFLVGLLMDIGTLSALGAHSLAYMLSGYMIILNHRQFVMRNYGFQAALVWFALACNELILALIRFMAEQRFSGWLILLAPCLGALLWPMLNKLMLSLMNLRRRKRR